jgi:acyl-CoA thioester hydrolase
MREAGYAWPVIDLHLRYIRPIQFRQWITIRTELVEYETRLRILYTIIDKNTGERLTKARTDQVAVDMKNNEMLLASPDILLEKLGKK